MLEIRAGSLLLLAAPGCFYPKRSPETTATISSPPKDKSALRAAVSLRASPAAGERSTPASPAPPPAPTPAAVDILGDARR